MDSLSLGVVAKIFKDTYNDDFSIVDSFPADFKSMIPNIDLKIFSKENPTREELITALNLEIGYRTALMNYIFSRNKVLMSCRKNEIFIGSLIIQSFVALLYSDSASITSDNVRVFIALLVMSFDLVPMFFREINSSFMVFLSKISQTDNVFDNMPDIAVYISSAPVVDSEIITQTLKLLIKAMKSPEFPTKSTLVNTYVNALAKRLRSNSSIILESDLIEEFIESFKALNVTRDIIDSFVTLRAEIYGLDESYSDDIIPFLVNCMNVLKNTDETKEMAAKKTINRKPRIKNVDECFENAPRSIVLLGTLLSRSSSKATSGILSLLCKMEMTDLYTLTLFLVFLYRIMGRMNVKSLMGTEIFSYLFSCYLFDPKYVIFDPNCANVINIRQIAINVFSEYLKDDDANQVLRQYMSIISPYIQYPSIFAELMLYSSRVIDYRSLNDESNEQIIQTLESAFASQIKNSDFAFFDEAISLEISILAEMCSSKSFVKALVSSSSLCSAIIEFITKTSSVKSNGQIITIIFNSGVDCTNLFRVMQKSVSEMDSSNIYYFLSVVHSSLTAAKADIQLQFFTSPIFSYIIDRAGTDFDSGCITLVLLICLYAYKMSINNEVKIDLTQVAKRIEKVEISIQMYTVMKMIISGSQSEFNGIFNLSASPLIDVILKSSYRNDFVNDMKSILVANASQRIQCLHCNFIHKLIKTQGKEKEDLIDLFFLIANENSNSQLVYDYYSLFNDKENAGRLLTMTKDYLEKSQKDGTVFHFFSETNPIKVPFYMDTFSVSVEIMLCSQNINIFAIKSNDQIFRVDISPDSVIIFSGFQNKTFSIQQKLNEWINVVVSVDSLQTVNVSINEKTVATLNDANIRVNRESELVIFSPTQINESIGESQNDFMCRDIVIKENRGELYHFVPERAYGNKALNIASYSEETVNICPSTICNMSSFKESLINARGLDFFIALASKVNSEYVPIVINIISNLITNNIEAQTHMLRIRGMKALSHVINNLENVPDNLIDEFMTMEHLIMDDGLLYAFYKNILFNSKVWFKDEITKSVVLQKWVSVQTDHNEMFNSLISFEDIVYYIYTTTVCDGVSAESKSRNTTYLFNILHEYPLSSINDIELLFRLLEATKDIKDVPIKILGEFASYTNNDPELSIKIREFILGTKGVISSKQPDVTISMIDLFVKNEDAYMSKFVWFFLNETRSRTHEVNEMFAEALCCSMIGSEEKMSIDELSKLKSFNSISVHIIPFVCIISFFVSDEMQEKIQNLVMHILQKEELCSSVAKTINPLSLFFVVLFCIISKKKLVMSLVNLIKNNINILADSLCIINMMSQRGVEFNAHEVGNTLLVAVIMVIFAIGSKESKNYVISVITEYLLYCSHDTFTSVDKNYSDVHKFINLEQFIISFVSKPNNGDDDSVKTYGPNLNKGEWDDSNVAVLLLDFAGDEDLTPESIRNLVVIMYYLLRSERNSNIQHSSSVDELAKRSDLQTLRVLFPELARQKERIQGDCPYIFSTYSNEIELSLKSCTLQFNELESFFAGLSIHSDIGDTLIEIVTAPIEYAMLICPRFEYLVSYIEKKKLRREQKCYKMFTRILKSFTYDDSPFPYQLEQESKKSIRWSFDKMLRPFLYTNRCVTKKEDSIEITEKESFFSQAHISKKTEGESWSGNGFMTKNNKKRPVSVHIVGNVIKVYDSLSIVDKIDGSSISAVMWEWWRQHPNSIAIYTLQGKAYLFQFSNQSNHAFVLSFKDMNLKNCTIMYDTIPRALIEKLKLTLRWKKREISTYEYIHWLNLFSGRSFLSYENYPIFPWLFTSFNNDLHVNDIRNLSLNINLLDKERFEKIKKSMPEDEFDQELFFLFSDYISTKSSTKELLFEEGENDSIEGIYNKFVMHKNGYELDSKELPEEYFYMNDIFVNKKLPEWCCSIADFTEKNRLLLERDDININKWIDMVFGICQISQAASLVNNTYNSKIYFNTYEDKSPDIEDFIETHGNAPQLLFETYHVSRNSETKPECRSLSKVLIPDAISILTTKNNIYVVNDKLFASTKGSPAYRTLDSLNLNSDSVAAFIVRKGVNLLYANKYENFFRINIPDFNVKQESIRLSSNIQCIATDRFSTAFVGTNNGGLFKIYIGNETEIDDQSIYGCYPIIDIAYSSFNNMLVVVDESNTIRFVMARNLNCFFSYKSNAKGKFIRSVVLPVSNTVFVAFEDVLISFALNGSIIKETVLEESKRIYNDFTAYTNNNFVELVAFVDKNGQLGNLSPVTHTVYNTVAKLRDPCYKIVFYTDKRQFICAGKEHIVIIPDNNIKKA